MQSAAFSKQNTLCYHFDQKFYRPTKKNWSFWDVPSDTKFLLTKNYSEIIILGELGISCVIPSKCLPFLDISRAQSPSTIMKNNSRGIIFVQRVGNFYRCRLQILPSFGSVILPHFATHVFVCLLKVVTCLPSLPSERPTQNSRRFFGCM